MIWLNAEDSAYYDDFADLKSTLSRNHLELSRRIDSFADIFFVFEKGDVINILKNKNYSSIIMSPFLPSDFGVNSSFFGIVEIHNKYGILTTAEKQAGVTEYQKLNTSLGLIVEKSTFTFKDMGGGGKLLDVVRQLNLKYAFGEVPKAVFLAGIMGTGKSFFAMCLAGETGRLLVSFNLAKIMNFPNPIEAFDKIVDYLVKQNGKYLLWIDEIEKMFNGSEASEHIKNKFLTFLNDVGVSIKLDAFIVITANDVSKILSENSEMVRSGRVEPFAKIFLNFLTTESAINIALLYLNKRNSVKEHHLFIAHNLIAFYENRLPAEIPTFDYFEKSKEFINDSLSKIDKQDYFPFVLDLVNVILSPEEIEAISNRFSIDVEASYIVDYIDRVYKSIYRKSTLLNFPYVPAEIKEIIAQLFFRHITTEITVDNINSNIESIIHSNLAIGDAGKSGIDKMLGNKDKFSIVIE